MKTVADALTVARSTLTQPTATPQRRGRPPAPEEPLLSEIKALIAELPSYGYRRVWALLRRKARGEERQPPNHKRVYRVMKAHGLLLQRHSGQGDERRHNGRVAVDDRNRRWCSDGFEIGCRNGERVRIAFVMDCCDREVMGHVATTGGVTGEMIRDLMVEGAERRFGRVSRLPNEIEWLSDNGSCFTSLETRRFARAMGFKPVTTPIESPQSNGMAEALVRTIKRDYARFSDRHDARILMRDLPHWFRHYNTVHPHKALGYRSPAEFIAQTTKPKENALSDL